MAVRVAELDTLFTATIDDFEAKARTVERTTAELDGSEAAVDLIADAREALDNIDDLKAELQDVDRTRTEAEIQADVDDALRESERLQEQLREIDDEDVSVELDIEADKVRRQLGEASEGLSEFKDESTQIAKESATSFSGEFEDVSDVVRDLLANAFVGFGPAGIAAGVAAAAGIGVVVQKAQEAADEINESREEAHDLAVEIASVDGALDQVDLVGRMQDWAGEIVDTRSAWEFWQDSAVTNLDRVREAAQVTGEDVVEFLAAMSSSDVDAAADQLAGYEERLAEISRELDPLNDKMLGSINAMSGSTDASDKLTDAERDKIRELSNERDALEDLADPLRENVEQMRQAQEEADLLGAAAADLTVEQYKLVRQVDKANEALMDQAGSSRDAAGANLDLKDQIADTTETIKDSEAKNRDKERALLDLADQIVNTAQAEEDASGVTADYNRVIEKNRDQFLKAAEAAGIDEQAAEDLADAYGLIPKDVDTDIDADTRKARRKGESLTDWLNRLNGEVDVNADTRGAKQESREARRYIADLHANINVSADTGNAYERARAVQRYISGLNATMDVYSRPVAGPGSVGGGPTFADGGRVEGPGTETSDSIIARLSDEEHVWTAAEVRGAGGHSEVERLRQLAKAGNLPGFADGGPVIVTGTVPAPTASSVSAMPPVSVIAPQAVTRADLMFLADRIVDALAPSMVATNRNLQRDAAIGVF